MASNTPVATLLLFILIYIGLLMDFKVQIANLLFNAEVYFSYFSSQFMRFPNIILMIQIKTEQQQKSSSIQSDKQLYLKNNQSSINSSMLNTFFPNNTDSELFYFEGTANQLKKILDELPQIQFSKFRSINVNIKGSKVRQRNTACLVSTFVLGSIFVFPLFFICCDWWKRKTNTLYIVENEGYDSVIQLVKKSSAVELCLTLQDNFFNRSKVEVILDMLSKSSIQNFVFQNTAMAFDADGNNYSKFIQNFYPIKSTLIRFDVSWGTQILL